MLSAGRCIKLASADPDMENTIGKPSALITNAMTTERSKSLWENINSTEEGTYTLETTYLEAEGAGKDKSFTSKGKKQVIQKDVNNEKKTAIKLIPDDSDTPIYFVIVNDSTLRLVNEELQEAAGELNYDIVLVR
ncbi:copper resistance protein NlpE N-terminal domain-containing protein [Bacteroides heparinolyticus]|uniref:copper resistance protein NlpE N-terminal domain-containing protein n=1 Tax=Prevotella heparinolytica TaxID=28113 RepID=UPI00359F7A01